MTKHYISRIFWIIEFIGEFIHRIPNRLYKKKLVYLQAIFIAVAVFAMVSAVPVDESIAGEIYGQDNSYNPQEPQEFFKLKKIKKLFFG